MNSKQKKIIWYTTIVLFIIVMLGLFIASSILIFQPDIKQTRIGAFLVLITSTISPTTLLGIGIKWFMNKRFHKINREQTKETTINTLKENGVRIIDKNDNSKYGY